MSNTFLTTISYSIAGATALFGAAKLAFSTLSGRSVQIQGDGSMTTTPAYDTMPKRISRAAIAAITGAAVFYLSPTFGTSLSASDLKTGVAVAALIINVPSIIRNITKGDESRQDQNGDRVQVGPYSSLSGRLIGHIQEGASAAALAYLAYQYPEVISSVVSNTIETSYQAVRWTVITSAQIAYYSFSTVAQVIFGSAKGIESVFGAAANTLGVGMSLLNETYNIFAGQ